MRGVLASLFILLLAAGLARAAEDRHLDFRSDAFAYVEPGRPLTLTVYGRGLRTGTLRVHRLPDLAGTLEEALALPRGPAVRTVAVKLKPDSSYYVEEDVKLQPLPEGVYLAELATAAGRDHVVLVVSRLLLVTKVASRELVACTVDTTTGKPLPGVEVRVYGRTDSRRGARLQGARTGPDGVLRLPLPAGTASYDVVGQVGSSFNLSRLYFAPAPELRVYSYTDRPLYRPGHKVQYRSVVRRLPNGATEYVNVPDQAVTVEIRDSTGSLLAREQKVTGPEGTLAGEYVLPGEPPLGQYSLVVRVGDEVFYAPFKVEEYRAPEFTVTLQPDRPSYRNGETATVRLSARYLFGSPVLGGKYEFEVFQDGYDPPLPREPGSDDTYLREPGLAEGRVVSTGQEGEMVLRGEGTLDRNGEAVLRLPLGGDRPPVWSLRVAARVTDLANRVQAGAASAPVANGSFFMISELDREVFGTGDKVRVRVRAAGFDSQPVATKFRVDLGETRWVKGASIFVTASRAQGSTNAQGVGEALVPAPAKAGYYEVRVMALDGGRWMAAARQSVRVTSDRREAEAARWPSLEVTLDRPMYRPGDRAKVLLRTREKTGLALVTVEGERVHQVLFVPVRDHVGRAEVAVEKAWIPSLHVSAALAPPHQGPRFSHTEAVVRADEHFLQVEATPDRKEYEPGDQARVTVRTRDWQGKPTPAEVSLAVVDEAIFRMSPELGEPIRRFFWGPRENHVSTVTSEVPVYRGGQFQTVGEPVKVRRVFRDTAWWDPSVLTGEAGEATVDVSLPDNLTTWRITAVGATRDTRVGRSVDTAVARKPFMVRLQTPRFLVRDDRTSVQAHVHNETGRDQEVRVDLEASGLGLEGPPSRSLRVRSGEVGVVEWTVTQPDSRPGTLTARAVGGDPAARDGVEAGMRAVPQGLPLLLYGTGTAESGGFQFTLPPAFDPDAGGLEVRLAPGVGAVVQGALAGMLEGRPDVTEEIASRLLALAAWRGPADPRRDKALQDGLGALYARQNNDGGWPWSVDGESEPFTSARAAEALAAAREAGLVVDERRLERAGDYLRVYAGGQNPGVQAAMARASADVAVPADLAQLDYQAQALAVQALVRRGLAREAAAAVEALAGAATRLDGQAHWETDPEKLGWTGRAVETTAEAVRALVATRPDDPAVDEGVRWLLRERRGSGWGTTHATSVVALALLDWQAARQEAGGTLRNVQVQVNGQPVAVAPVDPLRDTGETVARVPARSLRPGPNAVSVAAEGGRLLYSWEATAWPLDQGTAVPADGGLAVRREYYRRVFNYDARGRLTFRYEPLKGPVRVGEEVLALVKVVSWLRASYMVLEDPLPAGFEARAEAAPDLDPKGYDRDYTTHTFFRDQKVVVYQDDLLPRLYQHTYLMRAERPGRYTLNPARVRLAYYPEIRGNSAPDVLEVVP